MHEVEVIAAEAQWSFNELEDIFDEQKPQEAGEESNTEHRLSETEINSTPDTHAYEVAKYQDTTIHSNGARQETERSQQPAQHLPSIDVTTACPQVASNARLAKRRPPWGLERRRWRVANPWQIRSSLDPFVHLPIEVSKNEQALLQFCGLPFRQQHFFV